MTDKVSRAQVESAAKALLEFHERAGAESKTNDLLEGDDTVSLLLTLRHIPRRAKIKPVRLYVSSERAESFFSPSAFSSIRQADSSYTSKPGERS